MLTIDSCFIVSLNTMNNCKSKILQAIIGWQIGYTSHLGLNFKMKQVLVIHVFLAVSVVCHQHFYSAKWVTWKTENQKVYSSFHEELERHRVSIDCITT